MKLTKPKILEIPIENCFKMGNFELCKTILNILKIYENKEKFGN